MNEQPDISRLCCVIFSFNRTMQLDLTLRSLAEKLVNKEIVYYVVYDCTAFHEESYHLLIKEWAEKGIIFKRCDGRFRSLAELYPFLFRSGNLYRYLKNKAMRTRFDNFKDLVEESIRESQAPFIFFSTDDQYLFNPTYIPEEALKRIQQDPENVSFRMGMTDRLTDERRLPEKMQVNRIRYDENGNSGTILEWNACDKNATKLWEYSFNVDFQVYSSEAILRFLTPVLYHIPTTLEWAGLRVARKTGRFRKMLGTCEKTVVGMQLNLAQTIVDNKAASFSLNALCNLYMQGYRMIVNKEQINSAEWLFMPDNLFFTHTSYPGKIFEFNNICAKSL